MDAHREVNENQREAVPSSRSSMIPHEVVAIDHLQSDLHNEDSENQNSSLPLLQPPGEPTHAHPRDGQESSECGVMDNRQSRNAQEPSIPVSTTSLSPLPTAVLPRNRIGTLATWTIATSTLVILGCMAFLAFIWFSNERNTTWHWIVANEHLITIVTALSKAIETSIQLQIGLVSAMLAALLLERSYVCLNEVVSVSAARLSGGSVNLLLNLWRQMKHCTTKGLHSWLVIMLLFISALCLGFSQVVTILLNRNIGLVTLIGFDETARPAYSFAYDGITNLHGPPEVYTSFVDTGWSTKLMSFPTFGEYSRRGVNQTGVSDTGPTLRAFLPYASASDRENIQSYQGRTTVIDTRVTCQNPQLVQANVSVIDWGVLLSGLVGASQHTPRLNNQTYQLVTQYNSSDVYQYQVFDALTPFQCVVPSNTNGAIYGQNRDDVLLSQWMVALCQLPEGGDVATPDPPAPGDRFSDSFTGGLISEFNPPVLTDRRNISTFSQDWGQAYMFVNITLGSAADWLSPWTGTEGLLAPTYQDRNEWTDIMFLEGTLVLSATLCYTSFASADLPVVMSSTSNRTEPSISFNVAQSHFVYDAVRLQMGQKQQQQLDDNEGSEEERGILSLVPQRGNWLANDTELPPVEPYIRAYFDMKAKQSGLDIGLGLGEDANWTATLWDSENSEAFTSGFNFVQPDESIVTIFQEIVTSGGSVAFALQTLYTLLASNIYYDKLPQFNAVADALRTDFRLVNAPQGRWGFIVVVAMVLVHLLLVAAVVFLFLETTRWTYLGQAWIMISQTRGSIMDHDVLGPNGGGGCTGMSDSRVDKVLKTKGTKDTRVGLRLLPGQAWPQIVEWREDEDEMVGGDTERGESKNPAVATVATTTSSSSSQSTTARVNTDERTIGRKPLPTRPG